ncbi:hypothetical protein AB0F20_29775 [Streptomyces goshikiensis]|uniref:hypothetical protein n=1 Tax=Streptomyces goshikiensis TaxID=1942 RepID=UPI0033EED75A
MPHSSAPAARLTAALARLLLAAADRAARRAGVPNPFDVARITLEELAEPDSSGADFFHSVQERTHQAGFRWPCDA